MREKLIELIDEAEEHSTDICVYSDCEDCPGRKYGNKCREYLRADHLIYNGVTVRERGRWLSAYEYGLKLGIADKEKLEELKKDKWWKFCNGCEQQVKGFHNFCPNCGADMRGEEDG